MGFLRNRAIVAWITPNGGRQFHPQHFAASADTLYALSREGEGSVGPLVAALTMAVLDALEEKATRSPGGRLAAPFVGVLDEAANICKLRRLDALYSHYGSRGIVLFTILQSWAQAADVWRGNGIEKLWSAANVRIYGGGVDDDKFLRRLSDLIGTAQEIVQPVGEPRPPHPHPGCAGQADPNRRRAPRTAHRPRRGLPLRHAGGDHRTSAVVPQQGRHHDPSLHRRRMTLLADTDDLDEGLSDAPRNLYADVHQFVEFLAQLYAREVSDQRTGFRWCARWHHHAEAVARLEACWKAFEVLRLDPGTGASVWFRDHLDPCMTALTHAEGPFARCSDTTTSPAARYPSAQSPTVGGPQRRLPHDLRLERDAAPPSAPG